MYVRSPVAALLALALAGCQTSEPTGMDNDGGAGSQPDAAQTAPPDPQLGSVIPYDAGLSGHAATDPVSDAATGGDAHRADASPPVVVSHDAGAASFDAPAADPCQGVTCPTAEVCVPATGACVNPCAAVQCAPTEVCIATIHGQASGTCVDGHQCDCSNCGNCGANGTFVGEQAFCGDPAGSPATMACNQSCGGGEGCIPFGEDTAGNPASICWPDEGCFGL
jgi:hypothetical protein